MEKLRQMTLEELIALCRYRMAKGKTRFSLYLKPSTIPPLKPMRAHTLEDEITGRTLRVFVKPDANTGGWLIRVRVEEREPFNPVPVGKVIPFKPSAV
jgi:hypothetical protein